MKSMLEKKKELEGGSQQAGAKVGRKTEIVSTKCISSSSKQHFLTHPFILHIS